MKTLKNSINIRYIKYMVNVQLGHMQCLTCNLVRLGVLGQYNTKNIDMNVKRKVSSESLYIFELL